jgi:serralysin
MRYTRLLFVFISGFFFLTNLEAQVKVCLSQSVDTSSRGAFNDDYRWKQPVITVGFFGGSEFLRKKVQQYASEWTNHCGIQFYFVDHRDADIRIGFFKDQGSWSLMGNQSAYASKNIVTFESEPGRDGISMNFGWFDDNTPETVFKRTILHEFGHALCLEHEHLNPLGGIQWDRKKLYDYYEKTNGWSPSTVDHNILKSFSVNKTNGQYDPKSIMHYSIPAEHTLNGYEVSWNVELSPGDKELIAQLYPKNKPAAPKSYQHLSSLTYGSGGWALAFSKTAEESKEIWKKTPHFVQSNILGLWGQGYQITHLRYGAGEWVIGLQKTKHTIDQLLLVERNFPSSQLQEYSTLGYTISDLSFGENQWVMVLSKANYPKSSFQAFFSDFPAQSIEEGWEKDWRIQRLEYVHDRWMLSMEENSDFDNQKYLVRTSFPWQEIEAEQSNNYAVTGISHSKEGWVVVLSTGSSIQEQFIKTTPHFSLQEIEQRLKKD